MRTTILTTSMLLAAAATMAQGLSGLRHRVLGQYSVASTHETQASLEQSRGGGSPFWQENFDGAQNLGGGSISTASGTWVSGGFNGPVWKHGFTGTNGCWSSGIPNPSFSSAANGYLIFDADSANCTNPSSNPPGFSSTPLTGHITSPAIDLTGIPDVLVEFSHATRWCCNDAPIFISFSGDGGQTWSTDIAVPSPAINTNRPATTVRFIASHILGNASDARIRFSWNNGTAYYWAIDDIRLVQPAEHDLIVDFGWISHINASEEYARIPLGQLNPDMMFGAQVRNFGYATQNNVQLSATVRNTANTVVVSGTESQAALFSPDTVLLTMYLATSNLATGIHTTTFEVTSDGEQPGGPLFASNTVSRRFEITEGIYALDGIGVHPSAQQVTGSLGNNSFENANEDFMMLVYYQLSAPMTVGGIDIGFDAATQKDGALLVSLHDTLDISLDNVNSPIAQSDIYDITQQNVNQRRARVLFNNPVYLDAGAYYAAVRMMSSDKTIRIQDDQTVPQPFYASMIYHPGQDRVFSNGNAFAIRLVDQELVGTGDELTALQRFSVFPNPASDVLHLEFSAAVPGEVVVRLFNVLGTEVQSLAVNSGSDRGLLDVSSLPSGVYIVRADHGDTASVQRVVIHR